MDRIVYFDYSALMLLLLLAGTLEMRKMARGHLGRHFLILVITTTVSCVAEIADYYLVGSASSVVLLKFISNTIYFAFHNLTLFLYVTYTISLTDTWHIIRRNKFVLCLLYFPIAVIMGSLVVNFFTPFVFNISSDGYYERSSGIILLYAMAACYLFWGVFHSFRFRKSIGFNRFVPVVVTYLLMFLAVVFQYFFPRYQIEIFANTFGLLFVSMMVQRPEFTIDSETGLYKLKAYLSNIKAAFINEKELEIIQVNVTNYKSLREMLGYEGASTLLSKIGIILETIDAENRLNSEIYNLGGGKLRLVIEEKAFEKTVEVAEEINEALKQDVRMDSAGKIGVVANICIVNIPKDISNLESLMAFGDDLNTLPYTGKVLFASDIYKKRYYDIMRDIDSIIEQALINKKFEVYYQPIYSLNDNRFNSAEALLRLMDDKYGFISPDIFIPAAEKSGAIHRIGAYVLESVCRFISGETFPKLNLDYIEVNLSVAQCMRKDLADNILETIEKYGVKPSQINLEITETAVNYSPATLMDNLEKITKAGIQLSLDDFGTGYSNMSRIAMLPLKIVKLDRTFTNAENTPNMQIVLEDAIKMIKDMNMEIVVEGIENENLLKMFSDLKCEYIQGYYYSKPIPQDEFIDFILNS